MIAALLALALQTLDGRTVDPFAGDRLGTAFVFIHTDCPVSNRYVPELNRLHAAYSSRGIGLWVVYPGPAEDTATIRAHYKDYGVRVPALLDPLLQVARLAGATMTPEAAVFSQSGQLVYRGRIDDRAVRLGVWRPTASARDLDGVLNRLSRAEPVSFFTTQAVGCYIESLP
jgi:hypothetical protein